MSEEIRNAMPNDEVIDLTEEDIASVDTEKVDEAKPETAEVSEPATETETAEAETKEEAPAPAARTTRNRTTRTRRRTTNNDALDYMGSAFALPSVSTNLAGEARDIESIIAHNVQVTKTNRGEYQYMLAMMTGNDETRENNDHNKLTSTTVYAVQVFQHEDAMDTYGSIKLVFDGDDFTAYSGIIADDENNPSALLRRQRSYTNHAPGSKFQCVPLEMHRDKNGRADYVICSRSFAMEQMQNRFFFGKHPLAEVGGVAYAYVMAADDNGVRVECMGIETRINRGQLTARQLVLRAGDVYKPGMKIPVIIREMELGDHSIKRLVLSGVDYEIKQGLVRSVTEFDLDKKPHELAQVVSITPNYYIVRLTAYGIIGLIAKENVRNGVDLKRGDNVFMEIVRVNERYNRVMGNCYKV